MIDPISEVSPLAPGRETYLAGLSEQDKRSLNIFSDALSTAVKTSNRAAQLWIVGGTVTGKESIIDEFGVSAHKDIDAILVLQEKEGDPRLGDFRHWNPDQDRFEEDHLAFQTARLNLLKGILNNLPAATKDTFKIKADLPPQLDPTHAGENILTHRGSIVIDNLNAAGLPIELQVDITPTLQNYSSKLTGPGILFKEITDSNREQLFKLPNDLGNPTTLNAWLDEYVKKAPASAESLAKYKQTILDRVMREKGPGSGDRIARALVDLSVERESWK